MENPSLISEKQAAEILNLTPSALRKWRQQRRGPRFVRLSPRCVKYRASDIAEFLSERIVVPGSDGAGHAKAQ